MFRLFVLLVFGVCTVTSAHADILAVCTDLRGYSHWLDGAGVERKFEADGFKGRNIFLVQQNNSGKISYRVGWQDEGQKARLDNNPTYLLKHNPANKSYMVFVDASAESFSETYLFQLNGTHSEGSENGTVLLTQTRVGGSPKAGIYHGKCHFP